MTAAALTTDLEQAHAHVSARLEDSRAELSHASREDLIALISAAQHLINTVTATQHLALAHLSAIDDVRDRDGAWTEQHRGLGHTDIGAPGEAAAVMGLSEAAAGNRIDDAIHQITTTPQIHAALTAGQLDQWRAHIITSELSACPDDVAHTIANHIVAHYHRQGGWVDSAGPLRSRVRALILKHAPETITTQAAQAVTGRSVRRWAENAGTDHWEADIPVETSLTMWHAITTLATQIRATNTDLTADQARVDALTQLVLQQADITIHLHATTPEDPTSTATSGAGTPAEVPTSTNPAASRQGSSIRSRGQIVELGGLGPQPVITHLDTLGAHVTLTESTPLYCHRGSGAITSGYVPKGLGPTTTGDSAQSSDSYRVPADMARLVRLRDGHCRFPGCSINARFCDLDHVTPWPAGPTTPANLLTLCRRHHRVKQKPTWQLQLHRDGTAQWTTPTGQKRTTTPIDHLRRATLPKTDKPTPQTDKPTPTTIPNTQTPPEDSLLELTFARVLELHDRHHSTRHRANPEIGRSIVTETKIEIHRTHLPISPNLLRHNTTRTQPTRQPPADDDPPPF